MSFGPFVALISERSEWKEDRKEGILILIYEGYLHLKGPALFEQHMHNVFCVDGLIPDWASAMTLQVLG